MALEFQPYRSNVPDMGTEVAGRIHAVPGGPDYLRPCRDCGALVTGAMTVHGGDCLQCARQRIASIPTLFGNLRRTA